MSRASQSNYQQFTLGPVDSTGKRTVVPISTTAGSYKVPAYNLTQSPNSHVSGSVSGYAASVKQEEGEDEDEDDSDEDEDDSSDTDDRSDENEAPQANLKEGEGEDGGEEESDNSDSGSGDAEDADEEDDEAVASEDDEDDEEDETTMPKSILKTSPSTRRKSVVVEAPGVSDQQTDPWYYKTQAKADKKVLKREWLVSPGEKKEQREALKRAKERKKRWSEHGVSSTGSGTVTTGTSEQPISQPVSEKDSRSTDISRTAPASSTSVKSGKGRSVLSFREGNDASEVAGAGCLSDFP
jgi:hypothetical protein